MRSDVVWPVPIHILLVEDNPGDVLLTQEALSESGLPYSIDVVTDGIDAMRFLHCNEPYSNARRPDLILLDWNLPRVDGRAVLEQIKQHDCLRMIPVVVLTTSSARNDVQRAYELHANCFVTKPVNLEKFFSVISELERFWSCVASLPPS